MDPRLDYKVMIEELVRLIRATDPIIICEIKGTNNPTLSGFHVSFKSD
jgi:hypothetical protein